MVTHARSGGDLEVMGMLQGRVEAHTFYVVDVFALPVEGMLVFIHIKFNVCIF